MPDDAFDPKREKLVMETKTIWSPECNGLPAEEKARIADQLHNDPERASQIRYTRSHTGFIREITVTQSDLGRLRQSQTTTQ
jgi:hypothetical protein